LTVTVLVLSCTEKENTVKTSIVKIEYRLQQHRKRKASA
jgi:hypothetical protein